MWRYDMISSVPGMARASDREPTGSRSHTAPCSTALCRRGGNHRRCRPRHDGGLVTIGPQHHDRSPRSRSRIVCFAPVTRSGRSRGRSVTAGLYDRTMVDLQDWTGATHPDLRFALPATSGADDARLRATRKIVGRRHGFPAPLGVAAAGFARRVAHAGLTPDDLFARLEAGVDAWLSDVPAGPPVARALADAVVLHLWTFARDAYHDTRVAVAAVEAHRTPRDRPPPTADGPC